MKTYYYTLSILAKYIDNEPYYRYRPALKQ